MEVRGSRTKIGGAQVVVAGELELALIRLVRARAAVVGWPAGGLAWPHALFAFLLTGPQVGNVLVF